MSVFNLSKRWDDIWFSSILHCLQPDAHWIPSVPNLSTYTFPVVRRLLTATPSYFSTLFKTPSTVSSSALFIRPRVFPLWARFACFLTPQLLVTSALASLPCHLVPATYLNIQGSLALNTSIHFLVRGHVSAPYSITDLVHAWYSPALFFGRKLRFTRRLAASLHFNHHAAATLALTALSTPASWSRTSPKWQLSSIHLYFVTRSFLSLLSPYASWACLHSSYISEACASKEAPPPATMHAAEFTPPPFPQHPHGHYAYLIFTSFLVTMYLFFSHFNFPTSLLHSFSPFIKLIFHFCRLSVYYQIIWTQHLTWCLSSCFPCCPSISFNRRGLRTIPWWTHTPIFNSPHVPKPVFIPDLVSSHSSITDPINLSGTLCPLSSSLIISGGTL